MQPELYTDMAQLEASHFWFRARRVVLESCLKCYLTRTGHALVLDAGCGVGTNLTFLEGFGKVLGIDSFHDACRHVSRVRPGYVLEGRLESLPISKNSFDLVAILDVLEHVEHQQDVLSEIKRVLKPGGTALITVPAFRHLWSGHDISHHHKRRYRSSALRLELASAGLKVEYLSYFNTHLYPLIVSARLLSRLKRTQASDMKAPLDTVNSLFYWAFSSERFWLGRFTMPFGVSLVAVAKKVE